MTGRVGKVFRGPSRVPGPESERGDKWLLDNALYLACEIWFGTPFVCYTFGVV